MDVKGKILVFVKQKEVEVEGKKELRNFYSGTISHKKEDDTRINTSINLRFNKDKFSEKSMLSLFKEGYCYELEITKGWLDTRVYTANDGKERHEIFIFVADGNFTKGKKCAEGNKKETASPLDFVVEE